jgi:nucleotide-binding universal stress UspA family protein
MDTVPVPLRGTFVSSDTTSTHLSTEIGGLVKDEPLSPFFPDLSSRETDGTVTVASTVGPVVPAERFRDLAPAVAPVGQGLRSVVVALDGTAVAEAGIPHSVKIARATGARVHLLRVVPASVPATLPIIATDLVLDVPNAVALDDADASDTLAFGAKLYLEAVAERLRATGIDVQTHVRAGSPGATIAAGAGALGADLLVIASEPHRGLKRLAGSVADELFRGAPCPVVYVRTGAPNEERVPTGVRNFGTDVARAGAVTAVRLGLREVPVDRITGSVGRTHELLPTFLPRRSRKEDTARFVGVRARLERGDPMPPLELYKLGYDYYVLDGHHRVAAARQLGIGELEAEVTEYLSPSDAEQQQVFIERRAFERETGLTKIGASRIGTYPALAELRDAAPANALGRNRARSEADDTAREMWLRWYFAFFQPLQKSIRKRGLRTVFPGERSADILVRLAQFRETQARLGQEVSWETALDHFEVAYGRRSRTRSWSLRDLVSSVAPRPA